MTIVTIRLVLAALIALCGAFLLVRIITAVIASGSYPEAIPGLVLGGAMVALGSYRIALAYRAHNAQRP
jgi:ABC-type enterochelin transport system permease subunit